MAKSTEFIRTLVHKSLAEAGLDVGAPPQGTASNGASKQKQAPAPSTQSQTKKTTQQPDAQDSQQQDDSQSQEQPAPEEVTPEMVAEKINSLRSGKSLKDEGVFLEFSNYINGMSEEERLALWSYVSGLAEILEGSTNDDATGPDDISSDVSIAPQTGGESKPPVSSEKFAPIKVKRSLETVSPPTKI